MKTNSEKQEIPRSGENPGKIIVTFLHGRVDRSGNDSSSSGDIVFSEYSYAQTRETSVSYLTEQIKRSAFLAVGSSLLDEPLIEALANTKKESTLPRYALVTLPLALNSDADDDEKAARIHTALTYRGKISAWRFCSPPIFRRLRSLWRSSLSTPFVLITGGKFLRASSTLSG